MKAFADYHTHTVHSHGRGTVRQNVEAAWRAGLREVGLSDHGPAIRWGLGTESIEALVAIRREVEECTETYGCVKALLSCEANIIDEEGHLDVPLPVQHELDMVLAGFHRMIRPRSTWQGLRFAASEILGPFSPALARRQRVRNTKTVIEALYLNDIDILTHPGLHIDIDTIELAQASIKTETCLEINCHHAHEMGDFVKTAARAGAYFAVDSDAHSPGDVGRLQEGLNVAELAGLGPGQLLNVE